MCSMQIKALNNRDKCLYTIEEYMAATKGSRMKIAAIKASNIFLIWCKKDWQERLFTTKAIVYQVAPYSESKITSSKINT
jgi:hypothetical protein